MPPCRLSGNRNEGRGGAKEHQETEKELVTTKTENDSEIPRVGARAATAEAAATHESGLARWLDDTGQVKSRTNVNYKRAWGL